MVFPGWIVVVLPSWTGLSGRFVEEEGRGRLGTVDERKDGRMVEGDRWCLLGLVLMGEGTF